jgi:hypothetical protein
MIPYAGQGTLYDAFVATWAQMTAFAFLWVSGWLRRGASDRDRW